MKITKDTTLDELINNPEARRILIKHHLPCLSCPFVEVEMKNLKIGEVCKMYGIDAKSLLKELNKVYKKEVL